MQIDLVYLEKYTRLMVKNIQSIEWTPTKNLMVMIGSNGSGKSSLMEELSPLPAHHSEFEKGGGIKEFHCRHKGSRYVLESTYGKGTGYHKFVKDDIELNPGHTYAVQEELCKQEFGLTREIHDLQIGKTKFSKMSTAKRREWLTKASPVDLSYAFAVLDDVSKEHRAQGGTVQTINKRLANENHDLLNDSEMNHRRLESKRLTARLNLLFQEKQPTKGAQFRNVGEAQQQLDAILLRAKQLLRTYPVLSDSIAVSGRDQYNEQVSQRLGEYRTVQAVVDRLVEELENLKATVPSNVDRPTPEQIKELQERHKEYLDEAEYQLSMCQSYSGPVPLVNLDIYGDPTAKLDTAFDRFYTIMLTIPDNADGLMNTKTATENKQLLKEKITKRRSLEDYSLAVQQRISRLKGCEHVHCPNCQHTFAPGINPEELPQLEVKLRECSSAEDRVLAEIKELEEYLEKYEDYSVYVRNYSTLAREHNELLSVWGWASNFLYRTPRAFTNEIIAWHNAQRAMLNSMVMQDKANVISQRLKAISEMDMDAVGYMQQRAASLEVEVGNLLLKQTEMKTALDYYQSSGRGIQQFTESTNKLLDDYDQLMAKYRHHADWLLDQAYDEEISVTQRTLAANEQELHRMEHKEIELRTLEDTVRQASETHADLGVLVKALSPKGGLIGRYLLGFLQGVTSICNAVIEEIWTYPMEILSARVDREDLDYKFPLKIQGGAVMAPDIEFGSSSQTEVADFAFHMALLKFLGFDDYPLYLDELGRTFDEQHRANLVPFISRLIEMGTFSQVFYISHFESTHGAFNQAEVFVLDPTNVTVPEVFNKNVRLT
jgi:energy-coupling factor transporter ATP-binding protein EcfA2